MSRLFSQCFRMLIVLIALSSGPFGADASDGKPGSGFSLKIVGGQPAGKGEWPWIIQLVDTGAVTLRQGHRCAGALIHSRWAITAAHCLTDHFGKPLSPDAVSAVTEVYDLEADPGVPIPIVRFLIHPDYDPDRYWNADIALLELARDVALSPIPIIAPDVNLVGKEGVVLGWGDISGRFDFPDRLYQATVPMVANDQCNEAFVQSASYPSPPISEDMLCAGAPGIDACHDDSGGPLVVRSGDHYSLAGIVSWGEGCAQPGFYGVYTRVPAFTDFIRQHIPSVDVCPGPSPEVDQGSQEEAPAEEPPDDSADSGSSHSDDSAEQNTNLHDVAKDSGGGCFLSITVKEATAW